MPPTRTLHGGCQCGRNVYIVQPPPDATETALLLFDPAPSHRVSLASPLPTYLRVPLAWYHSQTQPFSADETPILINRTYEHLPSDESTRRNFCGYCGTPLSFWSEGPHPEADYIRLALGSLSIEDLEELDEWVEDLGDRAESEESEESEGSESKRSGKPEKKRLTGGPTGIPWFDSFVEGSRLGRHLEQQQRERATKTLDNTETTAAKRAVHRHETGLAQSADGSVHVEWEVLEWTEGDDDGGLDEAKSSQPSPNKRARLGEDDGDIAQGKSVPME
ncbi:hypothetical protein F503_04228 [Ophiostoma piceae UAMH 11346]|uniref:CENP-V/GFA domain-containing protein n=1 Tax=Ophiostoma piceae (strain UAMH 11346) TaxID=1262450 RepID=S3C9M8_OPHP1|nr:hypothetical protein F503_04228 [Ophiostoma piceae UAMH 11346]